MKKIEIAKIIIEDAIIIQSKEAARKAKLTREKSVLGLLPMVNWQIVREGRFKCEML